MRRLGLLGAAMVAASVGIMGGAMMQGEHRLVAEPQSNAVPTAKTPAKAIKTASTDAAAQQRALADSIRRYSRMPAKHKNRAPGERAHRRWRKRRSAGRAA